MHCSTYADVRDPSSRTFLRSTLTRPASTCSAGSSHVSQTVWQAVTEACAARQRPSSSVRVHPACPWTQGRPDAQDEHHLAASGPCACAHRLAPPGLRPCSCTHLPAPGRVIARAPPHSCAHSLVSIRAFTAQLRTQLGQHTCYHRTATHTAPTPPTHHTHTCQLLDA